MKSFSSSTGWVGSRGLTGSAGSVDDKGSVDGRGSGATAGSEATEVSTESSCKTGRGGTAGALASNSSTSETELAIKSSTEGSSTGFSASELLLKFENKSSLLLLVFAMPSSLFNLSKSLKICSLKLNFSSSREFSLKGVTSLLIIHNIIS